MHSAMDVTKLPFDGLSLTSHPGTLSGEAFNIHSFSCRENLRSCDIKKWDVGQKQEKAELNNTFFSVNSRPFSSEWSFDCWMRLKGSTASRSCHQCWSTGWYTYQVCIAGSYYRFTRPLNSSLSRIHHLKAQIKLKHWLKMFNVEDTRKQKPRYFILIT